jgi:hypothetical protein
MALAAVTEAGIEVLGLSLIQGDFNEDLQTLGLRELRSAPSTRSTGCRAIHPKVAATVS